MSKTRTSPPAAIHLATTRLHFRIPEPAAAQARLLVLIPAFNEEASIARVVAEVRGAVPQAAVLVADDCSIDATATAAAAAGAAVLALPRHLGLGGVVQAGYRYAWDAGFDFVIRVDGDGQHDPRDIPRLYRALRRSGREMAIGCRTHADGSLARRFGRRFFSAVLRPILGQPVSDPTSGFVGVNRRALEVFSHSFPLEYPEIEALVVLQRKAFRFVEVPCRMRPRQAGASTITTGRSFYYVLHVLLGVFVNILRFDGRRRRSR